MQAADVDAEMVLADGWKTAAAAMVSNADTYVRLVTFPGGQQWSGLARDAMVAMVGSDRTAIVQARTAIDAMADKARLALDTTVRTALKAVVDEINDATGATWGFTVDDALGVSDPSALATFMLADIQRQDALERFQESIPRLAQAWWDASQAVADQISTDQAAVATVFAAQGPAPSSAHDAANTDRLATLDSLPTGLTQEAIRTLVLDSLKRNAAAKDVGKFGDSHVDEALNTIPFEQLVKMTEDTDQSWLKTLATTAAIILSSVLDAAFLGGPLSCLMVIAGAQVVISIMNYTFDPTPADVAPVPPDKEIQKGSDRPIGARSLRVHDEEIGLVERKPSASGSFKN